MILINHFQKNTQIESFIAYVYKKIALNLVYLCQNLVLGFSSQNYFFSFL